MAFNRIQQAADEWGVLVYALDQGKVLPPAYDPVAQAKWGSAASGICFGLALIFIARRQAGRDLPYSEAARQGSVDYRAIAIQNDFDAKQKTDLNVAIYSGLNRLGLKGNDARNTSSERGAAAADLIQAARLNGHYIFGLAGAAGAHAIVIVNEPGNVWRLFDANFGHFKVYSKTGFQAFLSWFLKDGPYGSLYGSSWICVCVADPPAVTSAWESVQSVLDKLFGS